MSPLLSVVLAASIGPIVFQHQGSFFLMGRDGKAVSTIRTVGDLTPLDLAASPDGETLVFTAPAQDSPTPALFRFRKGDVAPVRLVSRTGFFAQPTVTNDGMWIVFVHHPGRDGGPPGSHAPRAYGQLWRVGIEGRDLEQLTTSAGCKLKPDALSRALVAYTHADCRTAASVERLGTSIPDLPNGVTTRFARQSSAGDIAYLKEFPGNYEVVSCSRAKCRSLASLPRDAEARELAWGSAADLFVQLGATVFRVSADGSVAKHLDLSEALR